MTAIEENRMLVRESGTKQHTARTKSQVRLWVWIVAVTCGLAKSGKATVASVAEQTTSSSTGSTNSAFLPRSTKLDMDSNTEGLAVRSELQQGQPERNSIEDIRLHIRNQGREDFDRELSNLLADYGRWKSSADEQKVNRAVHVLADAEKGLEDRKKKLESVDEKIRNATAIMNSVTSALRKSKQSGTAQGGVSDAEQQREEQWKYDRVLLRHFVIKLEEAREYKTVLEREVRDLSPDLQERTKMQ